MADFGSTPPANLTDPTSWNMSFSNSTFHSSYHPLPEIGDFISGLAKDHPDLVELLSIGRSGEQREMTVVKISNARLPVPGGRDGAPLKSKGAVVITGAQHAREVRLPRGYVSHAQVLISSLPSGSRSLQLYTSLTGSLQSPRNTTR